MANSEFDKFKKGMSATKSLGAALNPKPVLVSGGGEPVSSNVAHGDKEEKKQVSFYLNTKLNMRLSILKAKTGRSFSDLYEEAITNLLESYGE